MKKIKKSTQGARIASIFDALVDTLEFSEDEAERIIAINSALQEQVKPILRKLAKGVQCFGPALSDFEFTVPAGYDHDTQIDTFARENKSFTSDNLTSENFARATHKLVPGKTYRVRIFPILSQVTSEECISFLAMQGGVLVGGQGVTLLQSIKADEFPVLKWTISFDEKDTLWERSDGYHLVPSVFRSSDGGWLIFFGCFELGPLKGNCLLCFSE
jgi:hypothetical protein